tara:strand:+ start:394 stop:651 length:258 start_codon:yes stop_codon:yes gene_type:complete
MKELLLLRQKIKMNIKPGMLFKVSKDSWRKDYAGSFVLVLSKSPKRKNSHILLWLKTTKTREWEDIFIHEAIRSNNLIYLSPDSE